MNAPQTNLRREASLDALNAVEMATEQRPTRMLAATLKVWRLLDAGLAHPHTTAAETLPEVERELAIEAYHGATFLILSTDTLTGRAVLHTYRIRRGSKAVGWVGSRKVYGYTADPLLSVAVASFEPVIPWRWTPGCDVRGVDSGLIQHNERLG